MFKMSAWLVCVYAYFIMLGCVRVSSVAYVSVCVSLHPCFMLRVYFNQFACKTFICHHSGYNSSGQVFS